MRTLLLLCAFCLVTSLVPAQEADTLRHVVCLHTTKGDIKLALYNETPLHRDNFLRKVRQGYYDGQLFHRVISGFMIQSGDSLSRHAQPGQKLGESIESQEIHAEIRYPLFFHKRGALAAARRGDDVNPEKSSSEAQFYIVYGRRYDDAMLDKAQAWLDEYTQGKVKLTPAVREVYKRIGGTPSLDGQYTVFGETIEGLDVVKEIQWVDTDDNDRPLEDVRILKAEILQ